MNQKSYIIRDVSIKKRVVATIMSLPLGKPWKVDISQYHASRSQAQHAFWWVRCEHVAKLLTEAGHTCSKDEVSDVVLMEIYGTRRSHLRPELIYPARSLTRPKRHTLLEMMDLHTKFEEYAARKGILLPEASYDHP